MSVHSDDGGSDDSYIKVSVTPTQSAYFAGELFKVQITFANTLPPVPLSNRVTKNRSNSTSAFSPSHKRAVHSISSVQLAKPPTSPGTPKFNVPGQRSVSRDRTDGKPSKKGLIGKNAPLGQEEDESVTPSRPDTFRRHSTKAMSISTSVELLPQATNSSSVEKDALVESPTDISYGPSNIAGRPLNKRTVPPSPLARSSSYPIPKTHPHARKQSVQDVQLHDVSQNINARSSTPGPASTSFSVSLESISETGASPPLPQTPSFPSPDPSKIHAFLNGAIRDTFANRTPGPSNLRRESDPNAGLGIGIGLGLPLNGQSHAVPRSAYSSTFSIPGSQLLLWAYAQLTGTFELDEMLIQPEAVDDLRQTIRNKGVFGGGSMIVPYPSSSRGYISSFFSSGPSSPVRRPPSLLSSLLSPVTPSSLSSLLSSPSSPTTTGYNDPSAMEPTNLMPTFESQPCMLVVDLNLAPGESRTYIYTISLPSVLPPTFRGKAIKFSYSLNVGTCRSATLPTPLEKRRPISEQRSRIMKVPIRVYNNVAVGRIQRPYDLLWPIARRREKPEKANVEEINPLINSSKRAILPSSSTTASLNALSTLAETLLGDGLKADEDGYGDDDVLTCRESVEVLTRHSKKVSYDIAKDSEKVAVLTFVKPAYRLGETVLGVVELNDASAGAKVLKFSALLESTEILPASLPCKSPRSLRRLHAEHHSSLVPDTLQTTFSLDIPPDASPAFLFGIGGDGDGGLEWKVRICFLVAMGNEKMTHLMRDGRKGEWSDSFRARTSLVPLALRTTSETASSPPPPASWTSMFSSPFLGGSKTELPGEEHWEETRLETVECEVPIRVYPAATVFRPVDSEFDA